MIIPEIKRGTPQKKIYDNFKDKFDIISLAKEFEGVGATKIVINSHSLFFGEKKFISDVRENTNLEIIARDYVLTKANIEELKLVGAHSLIIMTHYLGADVLKELTSYAVCCDLEPIIEVYNLRDMSKLNSIESKRISINNIDYFTGEANFRRSKVLYDEIPSKFMDLLSYEGVSSPLQIQQLYRTGYNSVIVGEALMKSSHRSSLYRTLSGLT